MSVKVILPLKETENQSGKEVIQFLTSTVGVPVTIGFEQFDRQPVESAGR